MNHPFFRSSSARALFGMAWITIVAIHAAFLIFSYEIPYHLALVDSLFWHMLFFLFSIGLWYSRGLLEIEARKPFVIFYSHLGTALISILVIVGLHKVFMQFVCDDNEVYKTLFGRFEVARYVIAALYYVILALSFYLILYINNLKDKIQYESELKTLIKDAELSWLKLQLNPHFLFNSLNSISSLTVTSPEKAQEMINRLSELLRYSLKHQPNSMVSVTDEVENCMRYLEIEKVRFGQRMEYQFNLEPSVTKYLVPGMVLQPIFENAVKHSVAQTEEKSVITCNVSRKEDSIVVEVLNTLPETPLDAAGTGIGLQNIKRRLMLTYGNSKLMEVQKTKTHFMVSIAFPIKLDLP